MPITLLFNTRYRHSLPAIYFSSMYRSSVSGLSAALLVIMWISCAPEPATGLATIVPYRPRNASASAGVRGNANGIFCIWCRSKMRRVTYLFLASAALVSEFSGLRAKFIYLSCPCRRIANVSSGVTHTGLKPMCRAHSNNSSAVPSLWLAIQALAALEAAAKTAVILRPILTWLSYVDYDSATFEFFAVQRFNRCLCFGLVFHFYKSESFGPVGVAFSDNLGTHHFAILREEFLQAVVCSVE